MYDDEIKTCLNCKKPSCTNCLKYKKPPNVMTAIAQIDPITGETIKLHKTYKDAAEAALTTERTMRRHTGAHAKPFNGYLWRRMEVDCNDV